MFKYIFQFTLIGALLIGSCLLLEASYSEKAIEISSQEIVNTEEEIELSFKPKKGNAIDYTLSGRFLVKGPLQNMLGKMEGEIYASTTEEVTEITDDGGVIKVIFHDIKGSVEAPAFNLKLHTDHLSEEYQYVKQIIETIKNLYTSVMINHEGSFTNLGIETEDEMLKQVISSKAKNLESIRKLKYYFYPSKPIKVGDSWQQSVSIENGNTQIDRTSKLVDRREGKAYINSELTVKGDISCNLNSHQNTGSNKHHYEQSFSGIATMNAVVQDTIEESTGLIIETDITGEVEVIDQIGGKLPAKLAFEITYTGKKR